MKPILITLLILSFTSSAHAAIKVIEDGQLIGAKNVDVNGMLYDVEFAAGNCVEIFDGCDELSDFTFNTEELAGAASQALLNQVFINDEVGFHRLMSELTLGCFGATCNVYTPYNLEGDTLFIYLASFSAFTLFFPTEDNRLQFDNCLNLCAKWTPVPVPTAAWLFLSGLIGLVWKSRKVRIATKYYGI